MAEIKEHGEINFKNIKHD